MRRFGKMNWLLTAGLVTVAAIHAAMAWALTGAVTASLLARQVTLSREYMQGIVEAGNGGLTLFAEPAPSQALTGFAKIIEALPGVARANIYSADHFIRYSTEANLIGLKFTGNAELAESFNGGMSAKLEEISETPKPEHLGLNTFEGKPFIEAYVPLTDAEGKTFAVVELYAEAGALLAEVSHVRTIIIVAELLAGLALLAIFYGLFRRRP